MENNSKATALDSRITVRLSPRNKMFLEELVEETGASINLTIRYILNKYEEEIYGNRESE